jgi:D-alanyl-D-alanine carboxypeptidase
MRGIWLGIALGSMVGLWADVPQLQARSAILMEASTGQVLFSHNADLPLPPASLTKMMTAILVLERCGLEEQVRASKRATLTNASSMHLQEGEQVRVRDLLYALMLRSANDAAVALAEHTAGSVEHFVQLMNEKARAIGGHAHPFRESPWSPSPAPLLHGARPRPDCLLCDGKPPVPRHRLPAQGAH